MRPFTAEQEREIRRLAELVAETVVLWALCVALGIWVVHLIILELFA